VRSGTALFSMLLFMGDVMWDRVNMVFNRQRYQKSWKVSGLILKAPARAGMWLALSVGLTACAGSEGTAATSAQTPSAAAPSQTSAAATDLRRSLLPATQGAPTQLASLGTI